MLISGDATIMGKERNRRLAPVLGWGTTATMTVAGVIGLWQTFSG